jgi:uncharacterized membrane-anchored protein YjiN (DUF445 family)
MACVRDSRKGVIHVVLMPEDKKQLEDWALDIMNKEGFDVLVAEVWNMVTRRLELKRPSEQALAYGGLILATSHLVREMLEDDKARKGFVAVVNTIAQSEIESVPIPSKTEVHALLSR